MRAKLLREVDLIRVESHDTQPQFAQQRPVVRLQFACIQQVGNHHRQATRKRLLQEPPSLQIDQD
ncbi:hypothetical protein C8235_13660 [Paracidovorax avenae]|nr:hypothetical protein C8235_13660 [Paracidovorax avenae]